MAATDQEAEFNPFAAPRSAAEDSTRPDWYKVDSTRISYAEYWRICNGPISFLLAALFKTLRIRRNFGSAVPLLERVPAVEPEQVPKHVWDAWRPAFDDCAARGFRLRLCYPFPAVGVNKECYTAVLAPDDALAVASLSYIRVHIMSRIVEVVQFAVTSRLADGRRVSLQNSGKRLNYPPDVVVRVARGKTMGELLDRHRDWLASEVWTAVPVPLDDPRPARIKYAVVKGLR